MRDKINILIADDNREFCEILQEYISTQDDFNMLE